MIKDILIKTAELLNRDDIINELNSQTPSTSQALQNDILRLISYYNYTIETLCENYFNMTNTQTIISDKNRKISFLNFNYEPTKILSVKYHEKFVFFSEYAKYITVPESKTPYEVTYKFLPDRVTDINSNEEIPCNLNSKIICYGIASEFLASKNQFSQAEYWNNKFMLEIFKSKTTLDRKLKRTFII